MFRLLCNKNTNTNSILPASIAKETTLLSRAPANSGRKCQLLQTRFRIAPSCQTDVARAAFCCWICSRSDNVEYTARALIDWYLAVILRADIISTKKWQRGLRFCARYHFLAMVLVRERWASAYHDSHATLLAGTVVLEHPRNYLRTF